MISPPPSWHPDDPLPDEGREQFAQLVAIGVTLSAAYRQAIARGDIVDGTARTNGSRMAKEAAVRQRIQTLRAALTTDDLPPEITRRDLATMMQEVTDALERCLDAARAGRISPRSLAAVRRAISVHIGRAQRMDVPAPAAPHEEADDGLLSRLRECRCAT